jgi:hypothetical protein
MAFGVASVVLQESCRIRCTAEDFGPVPFAAGIRWVIEPLSLVSCSFNSGHAGDRLRHGS